MIRLHTILFFLAVTLSAPEAHGTEEPVSTSRIQNKLESLSTLGSVLYVAAHPDDENTHFITHKALKNHFRVSYVSLTRGSGGQNRIGTDVGVPLGIIRTHELEAARSLDGGIQFFTSARDFGYSKTSKETLEKWDRKQLLDELVFLIRSYQPDVIVTRFPTAGNTHGHHLASTLLILDAYERAANESFVLAHAPKLSAWKATRVVHNLPTWRPVPIGILKEALQENDTIAIPLLGTTSNEVAARSRSQHRSQGFGAKAHYRPYKEHFAHLAGTRASKSLFDDIDTSWNRIQGAKDIQERAEELSTTFDPHAPYKSLESLFELRKMLLSLADSAWKRSKIQDVDWLIDACAGLRLRAASTDTHVHPGSENELRVRALSIYDVPIRVEDVRFDTQVLQRKSRSQSHAPGVLHWRIPNSYPYSNPYWLLKPPSANMYEAPDSLGVRGVTPAPLSVEVRLRIGGETLERSVPIKHYTLDPSYGERSTLVIVRPAIDVHFANTTRVMQVGEKTLHEVRVSQASNTVRSGTIHLSAPAGVSLSPERIPFSFEVTSQTRSYPFSVIAERAGQFEITATVETNDTSERARTVQELRYAHIPLTTWIRDASLSISALSYQRNKSRLAYVQGTGDTVPSVLRQLGFSVTEFNKETACEEILSFDTLVLGIRALNIQPWLASCRQKIEAFLESGGRVVAQYATKNSFSSVPVSITRLPFEIARGRVTNEASPVRLVLPEDQVLTWPHKITQADFNGWVQERGLYFAKSWDARFRTPLAFQDPEEDFQTGALLVATVEKGTFIYTGLSFFRQLPHGNPGAIRLFINLISNPNVTENNNEEN